MKENLFHVSAAVLLAKTKELVQREREITLGVLHHLQEIARRKSYLVMGYGTLFDFTVKELGYSTGAAFRRIEAMKLLTEIPEVEDRVRRGEVSLSNLALVQNVVKEQRKKGVEVLSSEKKEWVERVVHQSTREAESILGRLVAEKTGRPVEAPRKVLRVEVTAELEKKIAALRAHSHKFSAARDEELFGLMVDMLHSQIMRKEQMVKKEQKARVDFTSEKITSAPKDDISQMVPQTRYIPVNTRTSILLKSNYQCQYVDPHSKRRCDSRRFLQLDHIKPFSKGGGSSGANLQVLCQDHNAYKGAH